MNLRTLFIGVIVLMLPFTSRGVEVKEVVWGYDGGIIPETFNYLHVLIQNPTLENEEGKLIFTNGNSLQKYGAPISVKFFLSGGASKWVHVLFYINPDEETWNLSTQSGPILKEMELPTPKASKNEGIFLQARDDLTSPAVGLKRMSEDVFPLYPIGLDQMRSVVLDHTPDWDSTRKANFMQWLERGGVLHVLNDSVGRPPEFNGDLGPLNQPLGVETQLNLFRHALTKNEFHASILSQQELAAPLITLDYKTTIEELMNTLVLDAVKPTFNWGIISLLVMVYFICAGPVAIHYGFKHKKYRKSLGYICSLSVVFSLAFILLGWQGPKKKCEVFSLLNAVQWSPGTFETTSYTGLAVGKGGSYTVRYRKPLLSAFAVLGFRQSGVLIHQGTESALAMDIPRMSTKYFMHKGIIKDQPYEFEIIKTDEPRLEVKLKADNPLGVMPVYQAWILDKDSVIQLNPIKNHWVEKSRITKTEFFALNHTSFERQFNQTQKITPLMDRAMKLMISQNVFGFNGKIQNYQPPPPGLLLLVISDIPEAMKLDPSVSAKETGRALLEFHLPRKQSL
ncbi:MAG: hypothetical protein SGI71_10785 [Verrucomicrobiota bacterium]|nr:hypothetical protein [Verrucomicrobiota bacterium]